MGKFTAIVGIIAVCLAGTYGQENSVTVPNSKMYAKPGDNVALNCIGGSKELTYYISNRAKWDFTNTAGTKYPITDGFYKTTAGGDYADALFASKHFEFKYIQPKQGSDETFIFRLNITDVRASDEGTYSCSLVDTAGIPQSTTSLTLTVLSPVQKVTLEIHDPVSHTVLEKKTVGMSESDQALKLTPGQYMVKCVAEGSNPAPMMKLMYNEEEVYVNVNSDKKTHSSGIHYTSMFSFSNFELTASNGEQYLTCSANIAKGGYPAKTAGIKMMVVVDKPTMMCGNMSSMISDRYQDLNCNITAPGVMCEKVHWIVGENDRMISYGEKSGSENDAYDIIESSCEESPQGQLNVKLSFYLLKKEHFDTVFYLSYGVGESAHRIPVRLQQIPGSASLIAPLSLFVYLMVAMVTRLGFNGL